MLDTRWMKLLRDISVERGRVALMVSAVSLSLLGLGAMMSAQAILTREMVRDYTSTKPAAATLELHAVDNATLTSVRAMPGVLAAEARDTIEARVRVGDDWLAMLLFVVPDFTHMQLSTFRPMSGAWPPPKGTVLVEKSALPVLEAAEGNSLQVKMPGQAPITLPISGVVHDPALAPATMERCGYGYITPETMELLTGSGVLRQVKVVFRDNVNDAGAMDVLARQVGVALQAQGHVVHEIQVPPPNKHPHQGQMTAILWMLLGFAVVSLLLSAILVGTTVSSIMARQIREIGVMRTVGAKTSQVAWMYRIWVAALGLLALAMALPLSIVAGRAYSSVVARMLNFNVENTSVPWWVFAVMSGAALMVPALAAGWPIRRGSAVPIRVALQDFGQTPEAVGSRWIDRLLARWSATNALRALGLRNVFRHPGRLALTLTLLAAGGAMFMTARNIPTAWGVRMEEVNESRRYDVEIRLRNGVTAEGANAAALSVKGVRTSEVWGRLEASLVPLEGGIPVVRTYPDGGHGSFQVLGAPVDSTLVRLPLMSGRWLTAEDGDAVVLNHTAASIVPSAQPGQKVTLSLAGVPRQFLVVGVVRDLGSPGAAYMNVDAWMRVADSQERSVVLRVVTGTADPTARDEVIRSVESALEKAGYPVSMSIPMEVLKTAVGEHMSVLLGVLLAMAFLMSLVGAVGLASAMSTSVLERTRELGVMHAMGATPAVIRRILTTEGFLVASMSSVVAVLLSIPLSGGVGWLMGNMAFRLPLPLVISPSAPFIWVVLVLVIAAAAVIIPARRAAAMTVREALACT